MSDVAETLADRGRSYGEFKDGTKIAMALFGVVQAAPGYGLMSDDKQYAMFMFCAKMARLLNGDPEHQDSWHDIAGYATLAHDRCVVPSDEGTTQVAVSPRDDAAIVGRGTASSAAIAAAIKTEEHHWFGRPIPQSRT